MEATTSPPQPIELQLDFGHPLSLLLLAAGLAFLVYLARRPGRYQMIEEWCRARKMRVIDMDARYLPFRKGPFFLSSNMATVFYVTVHDALGVRKHLWVCCGHWFYGGSEISVIPAD